MKLFEGKTKSERNKTIAAIILGGSCLIVLFFAFGRGIFGGSSTTATAKPSPSPKTQSSGRTDPGKLQMPYDAFAAGLGDYRVVTTLCPGGKERMRRLMETVLHKRVDLTPLLTHTFTLDRIGEAYELFGERRDGVMKVAVKP